MKLSKTLAAAPVGTTKALIKLITAKDPDGAGSAWFDDVTVIKK